MCKDIVNVLNFYNDMPMIPMADCDKLFKMMYLCEHPNKKSAEESFNELHTKSKKELVKIIRAANPELIELKPGENIQL